MMIVGDLNSVNHKKRLNLRQAKVIKPFIVLQNLF